MSPFFHFANGLFQKHALNRVNFSGRLIITYFKPQYIALNYIDIHI